MTWNHRIMRTKIDGHEVYGLYEAYYEGFEMTSRTDEPMTGYYDSAEELIISLKMMLEDAEQYAPIADPWVEDE